LPASLALKSIYASSGADVAQEAMNVLHRKVSPLAQAIGRAPVASLEGLRAKALAGMWECMPPGAGEDGFNFDEPDMCEMLFRACVRVAGLSELATTIRERLV
jgi:hypothetical protein